MTFPRSIKIAAALVAVACLAFLGRQGQRYHKKHFAGPRSGEVVYREDCMRCHGPVGEGVAGKADEPLVGEKSVASLAKYIAREMPEDDPAALSMADATASAEYIHQAFYSAEARARNHPPGEWILRDDGQVLVAQPTQQSTHPVDLAGAAGDRPLAAG